MQERIISFRIWNNKKNRWDYPEKIDIDNTRLYQFTGATDIHGRQIFEGDVVNFKAITNQLHEEYFEYQVVWYSCKDASFFLSKEYKFHFYEVRDIEVVGNIFDKF